MSYKPPGVAGGGTVALGPVFPLRGAWSQFSAYAAFDVVSYNGSSYAARTDRPTGQPAPSLDSVNWQLVAAKGDTGVGAVMTVMGKTPDSNGGVGSPSLDLVLNQDSGSYYAPSARGRVTVTPGPVPSAGDGTINGVLYGFLKLPRPKPSTPITMKITVSANLVLELRDAYADTDDYSEPVNEGDGMFSSPSKMRLIIEQDGVGRDVAFAPTPTGWDSPNIKGISTAPYAVTILELVYFDAWTGWVVTSCVSNVARTRRRLKTLSSSYSSNWIDALVRAPVTDGALDDTVTEMGWATTRGRGLLTNAKTVIFLDGPNAYTAGPTGYGGTFSGAFGNDWTPFFAPQPAGGLTIQNIYKPVIWAGFSRWRTMWGATSAPSNYSNSITGFLILHEMGHALDGILPTKLPNGVTTPTTPAGSAAVRLSDSVEFVNLWTAKIANNSAADTYARVNTTEWFAEAAASTHYYKTTGNINQLNFVFGNDTAAVNTWLALDAKYGIS